MFEFRLLPVSIRQWRVGLRGFLSRILLFSFEFILHRSLPSSFLTFPFPPSRASDFFIFLPPPYVMIASPQNMRFPTPSSGLASFHCMSIVRLNLQVKESCSRVASLLMDHRTAVGGVAKNTSLSAMVNFQYREETLASDVIGRTPRGGQQFHLHSTNGQQVCSQVWSGIARQCQATSSDGWTECKGEDWRGVMEWCHLS